MQALQIVHAQLVEVTDAFDGRFRAGDGGVGRHARGQGRGADGPRIDDGAAFFFDGVDDQGNFVVLVVNEDERRAIGPRLQSMVPGIPPSDVAALSELSPQNFCTVFAYSQGNSPVYAQAVALIRAELPPRLRRSCVHEELTQGMGLANDSPRARPSIFNDDEEFAYLTRHDELLLKILYDPRLRPGMTEAEARPVVMQIATELLGTEV